MSNLIKYIKTNPVFIFRWVLFFAFLGHGLVSLGFSSSVKLHIALIHSVNFTPFSDISLLHFAGTFDVIVSFLILFNIGKEKTLYLAVIYLISVALTALVFYYTKTGKIFGFAEVMRRFPWIFYAFFLILYEKQGSYHFNLLRIGLAFAFLSHGLASLGIWGLNAGHIELANNILKSDDVKYFIIGSGIADTTIGIILLFKVKSLLVVRIAIFWIAFVVAISFMTGIPDGIFRMGFLLSALYVALNKNCHSKSIVELIKITK